MLQVASHRCELELLSTAGRVAGAEVIEAQAWHSRFRKSGGQFGQKPAAARLLVQQRRRQHQAQPWRRRLRPMQGGVEALFASTKPERFPDAHGHSTRLQVGLQVPWCKCGTRRWLKAFSPWR
jgi:hypothetical protein